MADKVRHQLFLSKPLSERLEALAAKPGASKSSLLEAAVAAWLDRRAAGELEDRFGLRLNRLTTTLARIERNQHIMLETLAVFVRYELMIQVPLAENDDAGRAQGRARFEAFVAQVGRQVAEGRRTFAAKPETGQ